MIIYNNCLLVRSFDGIFHLSDEIQSRRDEIQGRYSSIRNKMILFVHAYKTFLVMNSVNRTVCFLNISFQCLLNSISSKTKFILQISISIYSINFIAILWVKWHRLWQEKHYLLIYFIYTFESFIQLFQ